MVMNEVSTSGSKPRLPHGYGQYFDEWSERDATSSVRRDWNHPSVLLWSAGNEIPEQNVPAGVETLRRLIEIFHREVLPGPEEGAPGVRDRGKVRGI